jgi:hypothetical protein
VRDPCFKYTQNNNKITIFYVLNINYF